MYEPVIAPPAKCRNTLGRALPIVAVAVACFSLPAGADHCLQIDEKTGRRAAELIREAGELVYKDWQQPVQVETVEWVDGSVRVNGELAVDLAYVYIPGSGDRYENLGWKTDCGLNDIPRTVPRSPFAPGKPARSERTKPQVLGIVEIPALFDWVAQAQGRPSTGEPIPIREEARPDSVAVREVLRSQELAGAEYSYEASGAIVSEQWGNWFRVASQHGQSGWVGPDHIGTFHPLQNLLLEHLSYLNERWDGLIFEEPAPLSPARGIDATWRNHLGREVSIEVVGDRWTNGYLWIEVVILSGSPCAAAEKPAALGRGWVRAHDTLGRPSAWFYSRGC